MLRRENRIECNGVDLHFRLVGPDDRDAPVLLFAHCLGGDLEVWERQVAYFAADFRCLAYDLRGQGKSAVTAGPYTMVQLADDAQALLDTLGIEQAVFCGVSMGGMVALQAALQAPQRFRGLVLADTAGGFAPEARMAWSERIAAVERDGLAPLVNTMMGRWFTDDFLGQHRQRVATARDVLRRTSATGYVAACAAIRDFDLRHRLPEVRCPTLVICGENDPSTPLPLSQELAAAIPQSELQVIAVARHLPNLECPEQFNSIVARFLGALI